MQKSIQALLPFAEVLPFIQCRRSLSIRAMLWESWYLRHVVRVTTNIFISKQIQSALELF